MTGFVAALMLATAFGSAAGAIRVMLLDGDNNHRAWPDTSKLMKKVLDDSGLFQTTVVTVPRAGIGNFKPDWTQYQVMVMNSCTSRTARSCATIHQARAAITTTASIG